MTPSSPKARSAFAAALEPLARATVDPVEATDLILSLLLIHRGLRDTLAWETIRHVVSQAASSPGDATATQALDLRAHAELTSELRVLQTAMDWPTTAPLTDLEPAEDFPIHLLAPVLDSFPGPGRSWHRTLGDTTVDVLLRGEATLLSWGSRSSPTSRLLSHAAAGSVHHRSVVYDPACGTGELLWTLAGKAAAPRLLGNDLDPSILRIAHLRAALRGITLTSTTQDIVRDLSAPDVGADVVVCDAGRMILDGQDEVPEVEDPRGPRSSRRDQAAAALKVLRHAAGSLAPAGKGYVIVPQEAFTAQTHHPGHQNREWLVRSGALQGIVELGESVASYTEGELLLCVLQAPGETAASTDVILIDASQEDDTVDRISGWMDSLRSGQRPSGVRAGTCARRLVSTGGRIGTPSSLLPAHLTPDVAHEGLVLGRMTLLDAVDSARTAMTRVAARVRIDPAAQRIESLQSLIDAGMVRELAAGFDPETEASTTAATGPGQDRSARKARLLRPLVRTDQSPVVTVPPDREPAQEGDLVFSPEDRGVARPAPPGDAGWLVRPQDRVLRPDPSQLDPGYLIHCLKEPWDRSSRAVVGGIGGRSVTGAPRATPTIRPWSDFLVPVVPLNDQRELMAALRALDDVAMAADHMAHQARDHRILLAQHLRFRHAPEQPTAP